MPYLPSQFLSQPLACLLCASKLLLLLVFADCIWSTGGAGRRAIGKREGSQGISFCPCPALASYLGQLLFLQNDISNWGIFLHDSTSHWVLVTSAFPCPFSPRGGDVASPWTAPELAHTSVKSPVMNISSFKSCEERIPFLTGPRT